MLTAACATTPVSRDPPMHAVQGWMQGVCRHSLPPLHLQRARPLCQTGCARSYRSGGCRVSGLQQVSPHCMSAALRWAAPCLVGGPSGVPRVHSGCDRLPAAYGLQACVSLFKPACSVQSGPVLEAAHNAGEQTELVQYTLLCHLAVQQQRKGTVTQMRTMLVIDQPVG